MLYFKRPTISKKSAQSDQDTDVHWLPHSKSRNALVGMQFNAFGPHPLPGDELTTLTLTESVAIVATEHWIQAWN